MAAEPRVFHVVHGVERATGEKQPNRFIESVLHLIKCYVGTGIYAFGAAMKYSGTIFGPVFTIIIAYIGLYCQHMLVKSSVKIAMREPNGEDIFPTFEEVVRYSFTDSSSACLRKSAKFFSVLTDVFLAVGQIGFCIAYFIFISKHFCELAHNMGWDVGYRIMLLVIFTPLWLTTFLGSLRLLTPLSFIANFLIWFGICVIFYYTTSDMYDLRDLPVVNGPELPLFFGIVIFSFQTIGLVLPLRSEMKNPSLCTSACGVLNLSLILVVILYIVVGYLAYWKYGPDIQGSVFLNMPQGDTLIHVTDVVVSLSVLMSFALQFYILVEIIYPVFYDCCGPFRCKYLVLCLFRLFFVLFIYGCANVSENVGLMISLVGAISGSYCCIILPPVIELAIGDNSCCVIFKDILLIIFGIVGAITGAVLSVIDIINEF